MKIIFIADFFVEDVLGGGELNNEECIKILISKGHDVVKCQSHLVNPSYIDNNKDSNFIIANFVNLHPECIKALLKTNYIIYEHDHKYLKSRNPAVYKDFLAPEGAIVNRDFYNNAKAVLCQSQFHMEIIKKNIDLLNLVNLSGNLWSVSALKLIEELSKVSKQKKCSIMDSNIPHKNTNDAVNLCLVKKMEYELISSNVYNEFLAALGNNEKFVFLPKTPETLSRVAVEARMMNMSLIANNMLGATKEPWFKKKGKELIDIVYQMRDDIPSKIINLFE